MTLRRIRDPRLARSLTRAWRKIEARLDAIEAALHAPSPEALALTPSPPRPETTGEEPGTTDTTSRLRLAATPEGRADTEEQASDRQVGESPAVRDDRTRPAPLPPIPPAPPAPPVVLTPPAPPPRTEGDVQAKIVHRRRALIDLRDAPSLMEQRFG